MNKDKNILNKNKLVSEVNEKLRKEEIINVNNDTLSKVFDFFLEEIKHSLREDKKIVIRKAFSFIPSVSSRVEKSNPSNKDEKFVIPSQKKIKFKLSDS
jgi:nucleoid DNA-binding protein